MASRPTSCVSTPPRPRPTAAPTIPASMAAAGDLLDPVAATSRSSAPATTAAPATPWTARAATRTSNEGASAHQSEAPAGRRLHVLGAAAGRRRAAYAAGRAAAASARLNDVSAHESVGTSTSYWARISGKAIVTTDESASTITIEREERRPDARLERRRHGGYAYVRRPSSAASRLADAAPVPWSHGERLGC